jgi:hypothetical protein
MKHAAAPIIATAGLALLTAACGDNSSSHPPSASAQENGQLAFSRCLRSHGVPNFPDPGAPVPSDLNQSSPAFAAALQACRRLNPKLVPPASHPSTGQRAEALRFAQCVRTHGYPGFPDPVPNLPGPGSGTVLGAFNVYFVLGPSTGIQPHSAAFLHTATRCGVNPLGRG